MDRVFIHIPKTAGSSIKAALDIPMRAKPHIPVFVLESREDLSNKEVFTIVRNPFTRAYSKFLFISSKKSRLEGTFIRDDFTNYLNALLRFKFTNKKYLSNEDIFFNKAWAYWSQEFMIRSNQGITTKVFKYENIKEVENYLGLTLPKENVGKYTMDQFIKAYTKENINVVKEYYADDFVYFDYSDKFEDCLL